MESSESTLPNNLNQPHTKSRRVFLNLSSFQVLAMFRRGLFYTFLSIYMRDYLGLSVTATTLYATFPMVLSSTFQAFVWGRLSDRLQKRRTLIISGESIAAVLLTITYLIHRAISNLITAGWVLIIGLSVIEIFWSMSNIGWSALVSDLYPSKERSRVMAQLTSIGGVGRIIGIFLGGILYDRFYPGWGFRDGALFYIASIVMILSTIPMFFAPEGGINTKKIEKPSKNPEKTIPIRVLEKEQHNLSNRQINIVFTILIIALMFINFGRNSISVMYSQYLVLPKLFHVNIDSVTLSYIANVRSVATILVGIFVGSIRKKLGSGITLMGGVIFSILFLLFTTLNALPLVYVGSFFGGVSDVIITAASYEYAAALIPEEKRGKRFGVYNASFFLSWGLAGTLIVGPIIDHLIGLGNTQIDSYRYGFYVAMIITAIGLIIFISLEIYRKKFLNKPN